MNREDIEAMMQANIKLAERRNDILERVNTASRANGAAFIFNNYDQIALACGQDAQLAKQVGAYQLVPDLNIPIVDKDGNVLYETKVVVRSENVTIKKARSYSESHRIRLYSDGEFIPEVTDGLHLDPGEVAVLNPNNHPQSGGLVREIYKDRFDAFNAEYNAKLPEWSARLVPARAVDVAETLQSQVRENVGFYLGSLTLEYVIEYGMEAMKLPIADFMLTCDNAKALNVWTKQSQSRFAEQIKNTIFLPYEPELLNWEEIITWDEPFKHPDFKKVILMNTMGDGGSL